MAIFSPLAVANAVLDEADRQGKELTIMQLLKLVYISHGWSLALLNGPLVNQQPEAWQHGPVFPEVYRAFRPFGSHAIKGRGQSVFGPIAPAALSESQAAIVRSVVSNYGDMHAFQLSNITHLPDTPWSKTYNSNGGRSQIIPDALISEHYKKLAHDRRANA